MGDAPSDRPRAASCCEATGRHGDYSNCIVVRPRWKAAPNHELSDTPPPIVGIEKSIPISKLNVELNQTFGLMLAVDIVPE